MEILCFMRSGNYEAVQKPVKLDMHCMCGCDNRNRTKKTIECAICVGGAHMRMNYICIKAQNLFSHFKDFFRAQGKRSFEAGNVSEFGLLLNPWREAVNQ